MRVLPLRTLTETSVTAVAAALVRAGASAQTLVISGFVAGLAAALAIATHFSLIGLALLALNGLLALLAAAVARLTKVTAQGSFLATVFEFTVAASVPFAFALADPSRALAAVFLVFGFLVCGSASLSHKVFAAGAMIAADRPGSLSIHGLGAAAGRGVIFLGFAVACLKQDWFSLIAYVLGTLSFAAAGTWVAAAITDIDS